MRTTSRGMRRSSLTMSLSLRRTHSPFWDSSLACALPLQPRRRWRRITRSSFTTRTRNITWKAAALERLGDEACSPSCPWCRGRSGSRNAASSIASSTSCVARTAENLAGALGTCLLLGVPRSACQVFPAVRATQDVDDAMLDAAFLLPLLPRHHGHDGEQASIPETLQAAAST